MGAGLDPKILDALDRAEAQLIDELQARLR